MNTKLLNFKTNFIRILSQLPQKIKDLMSEEGNYFVGGFVRDIYLQQEKNYDIDIVVSNIDKVLFFLKNDLKANIITLDEDFGVYRVFIKGFKNYFDVSKIQGENIIEDLQRRDFSINAIAIKYKDNDIEIIDPLNGILDIETGIIRVISRQNLISDPLRLLRAYRFKAQLGFEIDNITEEYIKELSFLINEVAKERLKSELFRILCFENTEKIFRAMDKTNFLRFLFPFIESYKNFFSGKLHKYDLFNHSLETLKAIESFIQDGFPIDFNNSIILEELEFGFTSLSALKLTAFLHDIGKILTKDTINNKITFYNHDKMGAEFLKNFLIKEKYSSKSIGLIEKLIKFHLYPFHIIQSSKGNPTLSSKAYLKLKEELGNYVPLLFILFIADNLAKNTENNNLIDGAKILYKDYLIFEKRAQENPPLLNGSEIMEVLNIQQGPIIGKIILDLREKELEGKLKDKSSAQEYIRETYGKKI